MRFFRKEQVCRKRKIERRGDLILERRDSGQLCPAGHPHPIHQCCRDLARPLGDVLRAIEGGQYRSARNLLVTLAAKYPNRPCLLELLWVLNAECGLPKEAEEVRERLAQLPPDWPAVFWARISLASQRDLYAEAWQLYVQMRERFPQLSLARVPKHLWGELLQCMGRVARPSRLIAMMTAAREWFPSESFENFRKMLREWADALNVGPSRLLWPGKRSQGLGRLQQVPVLVRQGRLETALRICNHWRRTHPSELPAWWNCLILLLWLEKFDQARRLLQEMQEAGFPLEDLGEAWAAYWAAARPWEEERNQRPRLVVEVPESKVGELITHPEIHPQFDWLAGGEQGRDFLLKALFLKADASDLLPTEEGRIIVVAAKARVEKIPEGSVVLTWYPYYPVEEVRRRLEAVIGLELKVCEAAGRQVDLEGEFTGILPWVVVRAPHAGPFEYKRARDSYFARKLQEEFLSIPRPELDGKTLLEAAHDADLRPRVLGLLLFLEITEPRFRKVAASFREQLGFGEPPAIDPRQRDVRCLPPIAFRRVDARYLTPSQLAWVRQRYPFATSFLGHQLQWNALRHQPELAKELPVRDVLRSAIHLIFMSCDKEESERIVQEARELPAPPDWDLPVAELAELHHLGFWGSQEEFAKLFWEIRNKHWQHVEVRASLAALLETLGLIDDSGVLVEWLREKGGAICPRARVEEGAASGAASEADSSGQTTGLWLPPGVREEPVQRPRLWIPGRS